jgi:UDP-GlcNAc:undecaprenyl-phosphate/decaprenyl-phosphate GlcNAc-1-phosphate transferase
MTTIIAAFVCALLLSLLATPLTGRLGAKLGAMDIPNKRKVHKKPIPRSGGIAIAIGFLGALAVVRVIAIDFSEKLVLDHQKIMLLAGGMIVFATGLVDDFRRLGPRVKLSAQILGATLAYFGGLQVDQSNYFGLVSWMHFLVSYGLTVFWFLLFINAVNLIDGLDGLAGGIVFLSSMVMVISSIFLHSFNLAMIFAALAGAVLGFLRYNFNPASIFLGDGGSYFLGYTLAALSIMGALKSSLGTAMLIPLVSLGVPVFDAVLSPVRRFMVGKKIFNPDKSHIHHRLISMGLSTKRVVIIIYVMTMILCILGIIIANARDATLGLLLLLMAIGLIFLVRKVSYFDYFTSDKIYGWVRDITDVAGFTKDRRSFLSLQIDINHSANFQEFWQNIERALEMLEFNYGAFYMNGLPANSYDRRNKHAIAFVVPFWDSPPSRTWSVPGFDPDDPNQSLLRIELPLVGSDYNNHGTLLLLKDMHQNGLSQFTIRRVEHLRRTLISTFEKVECGTDYLDFYSDIKQRAREVE